MGFLIRAVLVLGLMLSCWTATAQTSGDRNSTALLYLRPTKDDAFKSTQLDRLPEAQKLRAVAENVLEVVSGRTVVRHEGLKEVLGSGYLVQLFDCNGEAACLGKSVAGFKQSPFESTLVGEYTVAGEAFRVQLRRFDPHGKLLGQQVFQINQLNSENFESWKDALQKLFDDTGGLRIATNVSDFKCTLDGKPCRLLPNGVVAGIRQGDHVIELSKEGYHVLTRPIKVVRGEEAPLALPMERLPIQTQVAPDPNIKTPQATAAETMVLTPFMFLTLLGSADNFNFGDTVDYFAPPGNANLSSWHPSASLGFTTVGVFAQTPKFWKDWRVRGLAVGDFTKFIVIYSDIANDEMGLTFSFGYKPSPVNSLLTGDVHSLAGTPGNLIVSLVGISVSKSFRWFTVDAGVGKPNWSAAFGSLNGSSTIPTFQGRLAYVNQNIVGTLYGSPYPMSVSVSGLWGKQRVGFDQQSNPKVQIEDLPYWIASAELYVPFGHYGSVEGEAYLGESAGTFLGAMFQQTRTDFTTGKHHQLRSFGYWAQLSWTPWKFVDARLLIGHDQILSGFDLGVGPVPGSPDITSNLLLAATVDWIPASMFKIGLQVHQYYTVYHTPGLDPGTLYAVYLRAQFSLGI